MKSFIATTLLLSRLLLCNLTGVQSTTPPSSCSTGPIVSPTSSPISSASVQAVKAPKLAKKAVLYRHLKLKSPRTKGGFPEEVSCLREEWQQERKGWLWQWLTTRWWSPPTARTGCSMTFNNSSAYSSYSNSITH